MVRAVAPEKAVLAARAAAVAHLERAVRRRKAGRRAMAAKVVRVLVRVVKAVRPVTAGPEVARLRARGVKGEAEAPNSFATSVGSTDLDLCRVVPFMGVHWPASFMH